jgi:hypothetical protein
MKMILLVEWIQDTISAQIQTGMTLEGWISIVGFYDDDADDDEFHNQLHNINY